MKLLLLLSLSIFALSHLPAAQAELKPVAKSNKSKKTAPKPAETPDLVVSVPSSEIDIPEVVEEISPPATVELGASSYTPDNFVRGSYSAGNSSFEQGSLPFVTINRLGEFSNLSGWSARWKAGAFASALERTVNIPSSTGTRAATQSLQLFGLRVGSELQSPSLLRMKLFAGAAFLPTLALSSASAVEGSVSQFSLAGEFVGGLQYQPPFLDEFFGFRRGAFALSAHHVTGKVQDSELKSTGVMGTFRLDL